jgi:hypothetical protein
LSFFVLWQQDARTKSSTLHAGGRISIKHVIERGSALTIVCDKCSRKVSWPNAFLRKRFKRRMEATMKTIAARLRCGQCASDWIAVVSYSDAYRAARTRYQR